MLYSRICLFVHPIDNSFHLLIPNSQFFLSPTSSPLAMWHIIKLNIKLKPTSEIHSCFFSLISISTSFWIGLVCDILPDNQAFQLDLPNYGHKVAHNVSLYLSIFSFYDNIYCSHLYITHFLSSLLKLGLGLGSIKSSETLRIKLLISST